MTAVEYEATFGRLPQGDELVRVNCAQVGKFGHQLCGICPDHRRPRCACGCLAVEEATDDR